MVSEESSPSKQQKSAWFGPNLENTDFRHFSQWVTCVLIELLVVFYINRYDYVFKNSF